MIRIVHHITLPLSLSPSLFTSFPYMLPTQEYTHQVRQLHAEAPNVEAQIQGFQPDLVRKTTSLHTVWEKFLQRVENRRDTLHMATSYYGNLNQVRDTCIVCACGWFLGCREAAVTKTCIESTRVV